MEPIDLDALEADMHTAIALAHPQFPVPISAPVVCREVLALVRAVRAAMADRDHRHAPVGWVENGERHCTIEWMQENYYPKAQALAQELAEALAPFRGGKEDAP